MSSDKNAVPGVEGATPEPTAHGATDAPGASVPTVPPTVVEDSAGVTGLRTALDAQRRMSAVARVVDPFLRQVERDYGVAIPWQVTLTVTTADVVARTPLDVLVDASATEVDREHAERTLLRDRWPEPMRSTVEGKRLNRIRQGARELCRPRHRVCLDGVEYLKGIAARQKCALMLAPRLRLRWFWAWVDAARFGKRAPKKPVNARPKTGRPAPTPQRRATTRRQHHTR